LTLSVANRGRLPQGPGDEYLSIPPEVLEPVRGRRGVVGHASRAGCPGTPRPISLTNKLHDDVIAVDIKAMAREAQQRDARETRLGFGRHAAEQRKINSVFKFRTRSDGAPRIVPIFTPVLSTQATSGNCFPDAAT
jgi:hypothetical protein